MAGGYHRVACEPPPEPEGGYTATSVGDSGCRVGFRSTA
jgi:hypothetical protein